MRHPLVFVEHFVGQGASLPSRIEPAACVTATGRPPKSSDAASRATPAIRRARQASGPRASDRNPYNVHEPASPQNPDTVPDPVVRRRPIALCRIDTAPSVLMRSNSRCTWRQLRSSTCAPATIAIRPAITSTKSRPAADRARSSQSIPSAISHVSKTGSMTFQLCKNRTTF